MCCTPCVHFFNQVRTQLSRSGPRASSEVLSGSFLNEPRCLNALWKQFDSEWTSKRESNVGRCLFVYFVELH